MEAGNRSVTYFGLESDVLLLHDLEQLAPDAALLLVVELQRDLFTWPPTATVSTLHQKRVTT
jgi:hypothetical protein